MYPCGFSLNNFAGFSHLTIPHRSFVVGACGEARAISSNFGMPESVTLNGKREGR
jgi:hypothetical protein